MLARTARCRPGSLRALALIPLLTLAACQPAAPPAPAATPAPTAPPTPVLSAWEVDNPVVPLPKPPLGVQVDFAQYPWVTPEKVRLGRWLFFDTRISADGTVSCATCHQPDAAFSERTPVSTGIGGQKGGRKAPTFLNGVAPLYPVYFWDGRAASLQEQAKGPMANPIEMGNTHENVVAAIANVAGYKKAFAEAFGDDRIDLDRIADAIAAYEATRLSGNSAFDRYEAGDKTALSAQAALGRELYFGKAQCAQCHIGWNFTDSRFYNLGIGWDPKKARGSGKKASKDGFADLGRVAISGKDEDTGAFKTPTLRDISKHPPYMHDGSLATLKDVMDHYNKGGNPNPWLHERVKKLDLTPAEVEAVVAFMEALDGEGYQDTPPKSFPQ